MEEQGAYAGEEQGGLNIQGQAVAVDQDGDQNSGTEHGEEVLNAQNEHFGQAQLPGVANGLVGIHVFNLPSDIFAHKKRQPWNMIVGADGENRDAHSDRPFFHLANHSRSEGFVQ